MYESKPFIIYESESTYITKNVPLTPVVVSVLGSSPLDDITTRHVPLTPVVVSVLGSSPLDDIITRHVPLTPVVVSVL